MFDNIDKKAKDIEEESGINLLPSDMRPKKEKVRHEHLPSKDAADFHIPEKKIKPLTPHIKPQPKKEKKPKVKKPGFWSKFLAKRKRKKAEKKFKKIMAQKKIQAINKKRKKKKPAVVPGNIAPPQPKPPAAPHFQHKLLDPPVKQDFEKPIISKPADDYSQIKLSHAKPLPQEDDELDVNLLPPEKQLPSGKKMATRYALAALIAVAIVALPYIFFQAKKAGLIKQANDLKIQIESVEKEMLKTSDLIKKFGPLVDRLDTLGVLLDNHIYWSRLFPILEKHTAQGVYFTDLSISPQTQIILTGKARNIRSLAEELVVLKNGDAFTDVTLSSLRLPEIGKEEEGKIPTVDFTISFTLDSKIINLLQLEEE